jgi:hypothetical protein
VVNSIRSIFKNESDEVVDIYIYKLYDDFGEMISDIEKYVEYHHGCELLFQDYPKERVAGICSHSDTDGTIIWGINISKLPKWVKNMRRHYGDYLNITKSLMDGSFLSLQSEKLTYDHYR